VQFKIGHYGSFKGVKCEKHEWKGEACEECEAASRLWHNPHQQSVIDSAAQTLSSREQVRSSVKIEEHEEHEEHEERDHEEERQVGI